jgi:arylsulfatase A-like enzyme/acetyl esterase/lipase
MLKKPFFILAVLGIVLVSMTVDVYAQIQANFYVSTEGSDKWSGTLDSANADGSDGPFATLERARDEVRQFKAGRNGDVVVLVRGGTYQVDQTIVFGPQDSSTGQATVTYAAYPNELPVFRCSREVGDWKLIDSAIPGLPEQAIGKVRVANVTGEFRALFDEEGLLPRARSAGFIPPVDGSRNELHCPSGLLKNWSNINDVEVVVRPHHAWIVNILPLKSVDVSKDVARTAVNATYAMKGLHFLKQTKSCWIENALEELDQPGEWVLNSEEGKLYFWPRNDSKVFAPQLTELIRVEGQIDDHGAKDTPVRNLCFRGLTFLHGDRYSIASDDAGLQHDWDMHDKATSLVRFRGTESCTIEQCRFAHSGGGAIRVDLHGQKNQIVGNQIEHIGGAGVLLCGYGPGVKDVNGNNVVFNNHIHHVGEIYSHSPGIMVWQSGENRIANNLIHHTPYTGIILSGCMTDFFRRKGRELGKTIRRHEVVGLPKQPSLEDVRPYLHTCENLIEYNEIHHAMEELGDGNGIYIRGAGAGNIIRGNYIHDLVAPMKMQAAIRTDGGQRDTQIIGNLVYRCTAQGIILKLNNRCENNFVVDVIAPPRGYYLSVREGPMTGAKIKRNVFYSSTEECKFIDELSPRGKEKSEDRRGRKLARAKDADTNLNIYFCRSNLELGRQMVAMQQRDGVDADSLAVDPLFMAPDEGDFRFRPGSPALKLGIAPFDMSKVGLLKTNTGETDPSEQPKLSQVFSEMQESEAYPEAPEGVVIKRDLQFLAADRVEKLDLYQPAEHSEKHRRPAVVIIHGGGWAKGDKARKREFVSGTMLAKAGYVAVSVNYETRKGRRWPTNLHDCKNAVRWLRKNAERLGVDGNRIGVIGGSAGGHLALMVAYTGDDPEYSPTEPYPNVSDRVSACVDMYGITNLLTRRVVAKDGTPTEELKGHNLFTQSRTEKSAKWRNASPVSHVNESSPPTLILHGSRDTVVDRDQSNELYQVLQDAGVETELRMIDGAKHAWPLKTDQFDLRPDVVAFFDRHLKPNSGHSVLRDQRAGKEQRGVEQQGEKPNVIFISVDDLNDWCGGLNGHPQAKTPNLDRLFQQGVLFTNAHCSQAVCTASRNSVLSGLHPSTTGWYSSTKTMQASYEEVMGEHVMLPQLFRENGYHTMAAGKVFHSGASDYPERTKDFWDELAPKYKIPKHLRERGDGYRGTMFYPFPKDGPQISRHFGEEFRDGNSLATGALDREDIPDGKMFDEVIADWAVKKVGQEHRRPFFLAVGFVRPHAPFTAPREFFELYDPANIQVPHVPQDEMSDIPMMGKAISYGRLKGGDHNAVVNLSDRYWNELVHGYLASVSFVDHQIGKVVSALEESSHNENTIVVLWSDHGQHLGEKRHWRKQSLWEESTRVPLFFKTPNGVSAGKKCSHAVSLLDLYPTLVELCDLPLNSKLEGDSLLPQLVDPTVARERPVLSSWYYGNYSVRSNDWRYIRYRDGTEELYDHRNDAGEHRNLANEPKFSNVVVEHQEWIPENGQLPAGSSRWQDDKLDRRIREWRVNRSVPQWLR